MPSNWISLSSGKKFFFDFSKPNENDIEIDDIAHALSMICRFNGHVRNFYSVAEHSVLVAEQCPKEYRLHGLLHDASEAFCGDVVRPLKVMLPGYKRIEKKVEACVGRRFHLRYTKKIKEIVKDWDNRILATEANHFFDNVSEWEVQYEPANVTIQALSPAEAKKLFLEAFDKYANGKNRKV